MDEIQALETDTRSTEVMKPGDGPLHDPAGFSQTTAVRLGEEEEYRFFAQGASTEDA